MQPPTVEEAYALYQGIPSLVSNEGEASVKRRALNTFIRRTGGALGEDFSVEYQQTEITTLSTGKTIDRDVESLWTPPASVLAGQTVEIGGQAWPIALGMAILAAVYVREATAIAPPEST
jgi:hypothetical protein